jgi:hypothetical protein
VRRGLRKVALVAMILALLFAGYGLAVHTLGFHGFSEPPQVGERADSVIERLGSPHFDSRTDGDNEADYRLGYTDGVGTRYHLRVQGGIVRKIEYSSR